MRGKQPVLSLESETRKLSNLSCGSLDSATDHLNSISPPEVEGEPITHYSVASSSTQPSGSRYKTEVYLNLRPSPINTASTELFLQPHSDNLGSPKSSGGDSAVELLPPSSDDGQWSPSVSQSRLTPESEFQFQPIGSDEDTTTHKCSRSSVDSGNCRTPERSLSPRIPFCQIQTPSFTQLAEPPSVIITDLSQDGYCHEDYKPCNISTETSGRLHKPLLERKNSNSSVNSDRSDSIKSVMSDSSYSIEDDEYEISLSPDGSSGNTKPSVSVSLNVFCWIYVIYTWLHFIKLNEIDPMLKDQLEKGLGPHLLT